MAVACELQTNSHRFRYQSKARMPLTISE